MLFLEQHAVHLEQRQAPIHGTTIPRLKPLPGKIVFCLLHMVGRGSASEQRTFVETTPETSLFRAPRGPCSADWLKSDAYEQLLGRGHDESNARSGKSLSCKKRESFVGTKVCPQKSSQLEAIQPR